MIDKIFNGQTVVCLASGPSLTQEQVDQVEYSYLPTIAINNTFKLAPWCDLVFACDIKWWYKYYEEVIETCWDAELWTIKGVGQHFHKKTKTLGPTINEVGFTRTLGLGYNDKISHGGNSGYLAVNLAYLMGAKKIILVGYDHQHTDGKTHWHGDHDKTYFAKNADDTQRWLNNFRILSRALQNEGIDLVNCSIETAITSCRRSTLDKELL